MIKLDQLKNIDNLLPDSRLAVLVDNIIQTLQNAFKKKLHQIQSSFVIPKRDLKANEER